MVATFVTGEAASLPLGDSSAEVALSAFGVVSRISFAAASARDYLDAKFRNHPLSVIARPILQPRGEVEAVTERALAILEAASEDPNSFRSTSS